MITLFEPTYLLSDNLFRQAKVIIQRSKAAELINGYYDDDKGDGGGQDTGCITYTVTAVLVAALGLIMLCRVPTYSSILQSIGSFSARQLAEVGMGGQDTSRIMGTAPDQRREYKRFYGWMERRLRPMDPSPDQPAKRITNAAHDAITSRRTIEQRATAEQAEERIRTVINRIVAGSIVNRAPVGAVGDLVADESIFDLAGPAPGLGVKAHRMRAASYCGRFYVRDKATGTINLDVRGQAITKSGFGIGMTALTRVGPPDALHAIAPVIVAIDIHPPTSGSVEGIRASLRHLNLNGFDTRYGRRGRWPFLTVDMGYNVKRGFARLMIDQKYSAVTAFPKHWTLTAASEPASKADNAIPPGPIQVAGSFYCPAAQHLLEGFRPPKTRDLLADNGWERHDTKLASVMPFLMGVNSRPFVSSQRGRPTIGMPVEPRVKAEFVCPAVQRRVQCPLKPESMNFAAVGAPLAEPTWQAQDRLCCAQSSVTVTLTEDQVRLAQWAFPGGSWDHILTYEANRALTEQRFSLLKSPHITGLSDLKWGPRREPMVKIILALAVAATNHRIQKKHDMGKRREESIDIHYRKLTKSLGHEPFRTPPLT